MKNEMIKYMVDLLFRDVEESVEVNALHDEVLANCQAHYDDLLGRGLTEEEAIAAVTESLQGMEEVVSQYPRKGAKPAEAAGEDAPAREDTAVAITCGAPEKKADPVREIDLELRGWDVAVISGTETAVHIEEGEAERIEIRRENGKLSVRELKNKVNTEDAAEELRSVKWDSLDEIMRGIKAAGLMAVKSLTNTISIDSGRLVIEVAGPVSSLQHHSFSGDLSVKDIAVASLQSSTTSGDIEITVPDPMELLKAHSTSGDITVSAQSARMDLSTMSGDVDIQGSADAIAASSVSGSIDVKAAGRRIRTATLTATSGSVDLDAGESGVDHVEAHSVSGDIDITLPENEHSVSAAVHTISGSFTNTAGSEGTGAAVQISAQTVSGNITVKNA